MQILRERWDDGSSTAILAAVGQLQFDVVLYRLKGEYGVDANLEPLNFDIARWVAGESVEGIQDTTLGEQSSERNQSGQSTIGSVSAENGWAAVKKAEQNQKLYGVEIVQDRWQRPVLLFRNPWKGMGSACLATYSNIHIHP